MKICLFSVVISEDMVKDGYEDIMNVDISLVAIEMMKRKYECTPQMKCILLAITEPSKFFFFFFWESLTAFI